MTEEQIAEIDFRQVTFDFVKNRFALQNLFSNKNAKHLSVESFIHLLPAFIEHKYPASWLREDHLQAIDFADINLDHEKITAFLNDSYNYAVAFLSSDQLCACIKRKIIGLDCRRINDVQLHKIDLATLPDDEVKNFFHSKAGRLSPTQLLYCLRKNDWVVRELAHSITDQQLKELDLSEFNPQANVFAQLFKRKEKLKMEFFKQYTETAENIIEGINAGFFFDHDLNKIQRLPKEVIEKIDFTQIKILGTQQWREIWTTLFYLKNFDAIQPASINCLLPNFEKITHVSFTDAQYTAIDFSSRDVKDYYITTLRVNNTERMHLLSPQQLTHCLARVGLGQMIAGELIKKAPEKLRQIDFIGINPQFINEFASNIVSHLTIAQLSYALGIKCLDQELVKHSVTVDQLRELNLSEFDQEDDVIKLLTKRKAELNKKTR